MKTIILFFLVASINSFIFRLSQHGERCFYEELYVGNVRRNKTLNNIFKYS